MKAPVILSRRSAAKDLDSRGSHSEVLRCAQDDDRRERFAQLAPRFRYPADRDLQSIYTSTFDLAPSCSPYLGVHLFGDESRDRARLMVGLRAAGIEGAELPDHIAEVLAFAPRFQDDEWRELVALVLEPALAKMDALLHETTNPYRDVVAEALALCRGEMSC